MLLGPLFTIEQVTHTRRVRHWIVRMLYAAVMLAILLVAYNTATAGGEAVDIRMAAMLARGFFESFIFTQMAAVLILTPAMVAGAVSQEYERRTLDYLLASCLSDSEIVLGKLAARAVQVMFVLLVGLPVLAMAMLLGGIDPGTLLVDFAITLTTLAVVAGLSMVASVTSRKPREAITKAYLMLFGWLVVPPIMLGVRELLEHEWHIRADALFVPFEWLLASQPFVMLYPVLLTPSRIPPPGLPIMLSAHLAAAVLLAWWSVRRLRRFFAKVSGEAARAPRGAARWTTWRPAVGEHAMLWKELFAEHGLIRRGWMRRVVGALAAIAILGPMAWAFVWAIEQQAWNRSSDFQEIAMAMSVLVSCGALLTTAAHAACLVSGEKERDTWLTLTSTAIAAREVVLAKLCGAIYAARWLGVLLVPMWTMTAIIEPRFVVALPFVIGTLLVLLSFAACLGLVCSTYLRTTTQAMATTIGVGLFLSGGYLMCCIPAGGPEEGVLAPCIPFLAAMPYFLFGAHPPDDVMVAYVGGVLLYIAATIAMASFLAADFDHAAGRARALPLEPKHMRKPEPAPAGEEIKLET